jgi:NAD(P)-dependent dehydrogenase (short-subunit alcohol dehydrogenase family)
MRNSSDDQPAGNNGIGLEAARQLAKHDPFALYICSRSRAKGEAAIADIKSLAPKANLELIELDLSSLSSVSDAAKAFLEKEKRLDILINNAGVFDTEGGKTKDGYETNLGVNHLGHALFTKLLLPKMLETAKEKNSDVRIVTLSSQAHFRYAEGLNLSPDKIDMSTSSGYGRYGRSKLLNLLYTQALAQKYPQITSVSLHPGVIMTGLFDDLTKKYTVLGWLKPVMGFALSSVPDGAKNTLWCATTGLANLTNGRYYLPVGKVNDGSAIARDEKARDELWDWTEQQLKEKGY